MVKEINISGIIGGWDWNTFSEINTDKWFKSELDAALSDENNTVLVKINSPGGRVDYGLAIANMIAENSNRVDTLVTGIAFSMGALITLSGGKVMMANNTTIMLHNASGSAWGNARDLRAYAEMLEAMDTGLANTISEKTGLTIDEVKSRWMDYSDHTLTAQQAKDAKLIDVVVNMKKAKTPENIASMNMTEIMNWYNTAEQPRSLFKTITDSIKEGMQALATGQSFKPVDENSDSTKSQSDMKIKINNQQLAIASLLGIAFAEGETEKEIDLTAEKVAKINEEIMAIKSGLAQTETTLTATQQKLEAEETAHKQTQQLLAEANNELGKASSNGTNPTGGNDQNNSQDEYNWMNDPKSPSAKMAKEITG